MSLPITIEGQKYFVTLPSLTDLQTFKQHVANEQRRTQYAAVPKNISNEEREAWIDTIEARCNAIDPFAALSMLPDVQGGTSLLIHALLRHDNPHVTLQWACELYDRAVEGKPTAIEALRDIRLAMRSLFDSKKNETMPKPVADASSRETPCSSASS